MQVNAGKLSLPKGIFEGRKFESCRGRHCLRSSLNSKQGFCWNRPTASSGGSGPARELGAW